MGKEQSRSLKIETNTPRPMSQGLLRDFPMTAVATPIVEVMNGSY